MHSQTLAQITANLDTMTRLLIQTRSMLENHRAGNAPIEITFRGVLDHVSSCLRISPDNITGKSRIRHYVDARWCFWTILHQTCSFNRIGELCGVDHTAVSHGIDSLADYLRLAPPGDAHAAALHHAIVSWKPIPPPDPKHAELLADAIAAAHKYGLCGDYPDRSWPNERLAAYINLAKWLTAHPSAKSESAEASN